MEFKDIPNQIKAGKSKEELTKSWTTVLSELKAARKQAASLRLTELGDQVKKLEAQLTASQGELNTKNTQINNLQSQLSQKIEELAKSSDDVVRIRAEFVAKAMVIDRLTQDLDTTEEQLAKTNENFLIKDRELASQAGQLHSLELKLSEALARNQDLLRNVETKETDIEKTHSRLAHYESGEIERNFLAQINALELKLSKLTSELEARDKELADFKEFLKAREAALGRDLDNEKKQFIAEKEKLVATTETQQAQIEELQAELVSFRRLLRREEERSRVLQEQAETLERSRRELQDKLAALGIEVRDYASKLTRYFALPEVGAVEKSLPALAPNIAAPTQTPSFKEHLYEETTIEEELLKLEGEEGFDLDLEPPPEEPL